MIGTSTPDGRRRRRPAQGPKGPDFAGRVVSDPSPTYHLVKLDAPPVVDVTEQLLQALADGVIVCDDAGRIEFVNRTIEQMSGYSAAELRGREVELLVPEQVRADHRKYRERYTHHSPASRGMGTNLDIRVRRKDGSEFPADIALSPIPIHGVLRIIASVRDMTERQRASARLEAMLEISERILRGDDRASVLRLIAHRARQLAEADLAMIAIPDAPGVLRIEAADGDGASAVEGLEMAGEQSLAGHAFRTGSVVITPDARIDGRASPGVYLGADLGPEVVVPLAVGSVTLGTLGLGRRSGARPFDEGDLRVLELFAAQAAVELEYARFRTQLQRSAVAADRDRIGRDLHDGVIQALFAVGMSLQAATAGADPATAERLDAAVDAIDVSIRDLRTYIFGLRPKAGVEGALESALRRLAVDAEQRSGIATAVEIDPVAVARLEPHFHEVEQAVREALSNVTRHSGAQTCRLAVTTRGEETLVEIDDDGEGFEVGASAQNSMGLANIRARAEAMGGTVVVESAPGRGSTVRIVVAGR